MSTDASGVTRLSITNLLSGQRVMGEADIINSLKGLAGINTMGDYGSGLAVDGQDPSQTLFLLDGAPIYFPYRFGGVFSAFNTPHFSNATFQRQGIGARMPSRLGSLLELHSRTQPGKKIAEGNINAGIIASSATIHLSPSQKFSLTASGRASYINPVFGDIINHGATTMKYDFQDFNLSLGWNPTDNDHFFASGFFSSDRLLYNDSHYAMDMHLNWRNIMGTLGWRHQGSLPQSASLYFSSTSTELKYIMPQMQIHAPFSLSTIGGRWLMDPVSIHKETLAVSGGVEFELQRAVPMWAEASGGGAASQGGSEKRVQKGFEIREYADFHWNPIERLRLTAGISFSQWHARNYTVVRPDPRISLDIMANRVDININIGRYSQFLHRCGLSEIGLASDFFSVANSENPAAEAWNFSATQIWRIPDTRLRLEGGAYFKILRNQAEYLGTVLEIIDRNFDAAGKITMTRGYNYGAHISLGGELGPIAMTVSGNWGQAVRHTSRSGDWFAAATDPGFSGMASASWKINGHWNVGGNFKIGQGRVYTPATELYILGGTLISEYGARNSARLPLYHRLDLSGSYGFTTGKKRPLRHSINLSLINALGHRNVEIQYFVINSSKGDYKMKRVTSLYRFLPSLSYSLDF